MDVNLPILWLLSSFVWNALLRCSMEWTCAVQGDRCFGLISYNLELLSLVGIIRWILDRTIKGCSRLSYKLLAKEAVQVLWCLVQLLSLAPGW